MSRSPNSCPQSLIGGWSGSVASWIPRAEQLWSPAFVRQRVTLFAAASSSVGALPLLFTAVAEKLRDFAGCRSSGP